MSQKSPFTDEWRQCLREHYKYVIREQDNLTESSLTGVLHRLGFDEGELKDLYIQATMRQDDLKGDFMPDVQRVLEPHPAECTCAICSAQSEAAFEALLDAGHDDEGQPLPTEEPIPEAAPQPAGNQFTGVNLVGDEIDISDAENALPDETLSDDEAPISADLSEENDETDAADESGERQMTMF